MEKKYLSLLALLVFTQCGSLFNNDQVDFSISTISAITSGDTLIGFSIKGNGFDKDMDAKIDRIALDITFINEQEITVLFPDSSTTISPGSHDLALSKKGTSLSKNVFILQGRDGKDGVNGTNGWDGRDGKDGISVIWKGEHPNAPSNPIINWAYYNTTQKVAFIWSGYKWDTLAGGIRGNDGTSIIWKGTDSIPPNSPQLNWAYFNSKKNISFIWNGKVWDTLAIGVTGIPGISITWIGSDTTNPKNPQLDWAYYNSKLNVAFIWNGRSWDTLSAGIRGNDGLSLIWRGEWVAKTKYFKNDIATLDGTAYIAIDSSTNKLPLTSPDVWDTLTARGAQGEKGSDGTDVIWRGTWQPSTSYSRNDVVSYNGSSYIALQISTNKIPTSTPDYWQCMAAKGDAVPSVGDGRLPFFISRWVDSSESNIIIATSQVADGFPEIRIQGKLLTPRMRDVVWWEDDTRYNVGDSVKYTIIRIGDTLRGYFKIPPNITGVTVNSSKVQNNVILDVDSTFMYTFTWNNIIGCGYLLTFSSSDTLYPHFSRKYFSESSLAVSPRLFSNQGLELTIANVNSSDAVQASVIPNFMSKKSYVYHQILGNPFYCNIRIHKEITKDLYEPDDSISLSNEIIVNNAPQDHTISSGDRDYFTFTAQQGIPYIIETTGDLDTYGILYALDKVNHLAVDDDSGISHNCKITWTCPISGRYSFMVRGFNDQVEGSYQVAVKSNQLAKSRLVLDSIDKQYPQKAAINKDQAKYEFIKNMVK